MTPAPTDLIEADIMRLIMRDATRLGARLWRNQTGEAWQGGPVKYNADGSLTMWNPRRVKFGLAVGSHDCIGFVLRDGVAVFTSLEIKKPGGAIRPEQIAWMDMVKRFGGITGIAHSVEEARAVMGLMG